MTDPDRRMFLGSLAALFAGFRTAGASELDLIKATDDFLEDPECEEEDTSSTSCSSSCSCWGPDCPEWKRCRSLNQPNM